MAESEKWSWKNIDEVLSQLEMLHRLVNEFASKGETRTKFVAHCSSGDRLSGFVVAAYRLQREIEVNFEEKRYYCFLFFSSFSRRFLRNLFLDLFHLELGLEVNVSFSTQLVISTACSWVRIPR